MWRKFKSLMRFEIISELDPMAWSKVACGALVVLVAIVLIAGTA